MPVIGYECSCGGSQCVYNRGRTDDCSLWASDEYDEWTDVRLVRQAVSRSCWY